MRPVFLAAAALGAALTAAIPAYAQTIAIPQSASGAEVGPFGADATYGFTTGLIGQSFVAPSAALQSFTFYLRDEAGATSAPQFRAYVAGWDPLNLTIGPVQFTSALLTAPSSSSYQALTVTANTTLTSGLQYVAFLSGVTSTSGVVYVATNDAAPYAGGTLVFDFGAGAIYADATQEAAFTAVFAPTAITTPEPATVLLLAGGLAGMGVLARRKRAG